MEERIIEMCEKRKKIHFLENTFYCNYYLYFTFARARQHFINSLFIHLAMKQFVPVLILRYTLYLYYGSKVSRSGILDYSVRAVIVPH